MSPDLKVMESEFDSLTEKHIIIVLTYFCNGVSPNSYAFNNLLNRSLLSLIFTLTKKTGFLSRIEKKTQLISTNLRGTFPLISKTLLLNRETKVKFLFPNKKSK